MSGIFLPRMDHRDDFHARLGDPVHDDVVGMHDHLAGSRDASGPEKKGIGCKAHHCVFNDGANPAGGGYVPLSDVGDDPSEIGASRRAPDDREGGATLYRRSASAMMESISAMTTSCATTSRWSAKLAFTFRRTKASCAAAASGESNSDSIFDEAFICGL